MFSPSFFHALPAKSQQFAEIYDIALGIIGLSNRRLAHEGSINAHIVRETMPLYDPVYRKWLISEKNKDEHVGQTKIITVGIPSWVSCPDGSHKDKFDEIIAQEKLKVQGVGE